LSSKIDITAGDAVPLEAAPLEGEALQVKARGYWELIWIRFRRDKLAVTSLGFLALLLFTAFAGGPIASHFLGHGPNDIFAFGMDQKKFDECIAKNDEKSIDQDLADGAAVGVNGTPAFFINGRMLSGAQPFEAFKTIIDEEVAKAGSKS